MSKTDPLGTLKDNMANAIYSLRWAVYWAEYKHNPMSDEYAAYISAHNATVRALRG